VTFPPYAFFVVPARIPSLLVATKVETTSMLVKRIFTVSFSLFRCHMCPFFLIPPHFNYHSFTVVSLTLGQRLCLRLSLHAFASKKEREQHMWTRKYVMQSFFLRKKETQRKWRTLAWLESTLDVLKLNPNSGRVREKKCKKRQHHFLLNRFVTNVETTEVIP